MITIEEAHKINDFLDQTFKFKVGDLVQPAALGEFVDDPTSISESTWKGTSWLSFSYRDNIRYQIFERWIQQCHGGVQKHYHCKLINREGGVDKSIFVFTEQEIILSAPFKNGAILSDETIKKYLDSRIKHDLPETRDVTPKK